MPHMSHYTSHYNPLQPRVPRGYPNGGEWTDDNFTPLHLAFLRPRQSPVKPSDGKAIADALAAALALLEFAWLSLWNGLDGQAVMKFRAREYRPSERRGKLYLEEVKFLTREEVKKVCESLNRVQEYTDQAVQEVEEARESDASLRDPVRFGTKVHLKVKEKVEGKPSTSDDPDLQKEPPTNWNFIAETSYLKWREEAFGTEEWARYEAERKKYGRTDKTVPYATRESVRVDVLNNLGDGTVCVYDIKTGKRSPLTGPRMAEIAATVFGAYGKQVQRIVITEVTPFAGALSKKEAR